MRLVDTSAWIEWLIASPVAASVAAELPDRGQWLIPTIVQFELAKWLTREAGEDKADQVIAFTETCVVAELNTVIALSAADLSARHNLAMADAVVYATAIAHGAESSDLRSAFRGAARRAVSIQGKGTIAIGCAGEPHWGAIDTLTPRRTQRRGILRYRIYPPIICAVMWREQDWNPCKYPLHRSQKKFLIPCL